MTIEQFLADVENALHLQLHGWRKDLLVEKVKEYVASNTSSVDYTEKHNETTDLPSAEDLDAVAAEQEAARATE